MSFRAPYSGTSAPSDLLPGVHGLRGIAALSIVAYHLNHSSKLPLPPELAFVGWELGHGVHLFFVVSAFSLLHSRGRHASSSDWVVEYGIRRWFRIAPLFYAVLLWYLIFYASFFERPHTLTQVVLNATFLFNLSGTHETSLVWAGWTVGVEAVFYLLFPAMVWWTARRPVTLVSVGIAFAASYGAHLAIAAATSERYAYVAFPSNFFVFVLGFFAYRLYADPAWAHWLERRLLPIGTVALLVTLCLVGRELRAPGRPDLLLWGAGFAVLCAWQAKRPSRAVANAFLTHVGERSFSVYLLHPQVLFFLQPWTQAIHSEMAARIGAFAFLPCLVIVTGVTLAVSELSYRLIEAPGIRAGRALIERRRRRRGANRPEPSGNQSVTMGSIAREDAS